jgi:hypothetical protein
LPSEKTPPDLSFEFVKALLHSSKSPHKPSSSHCAYVSAFVH